LLLYSIRCALSFDILPRRARRAPLTTRTGLARRWPARPRTNHKRSPTIDGGGGRWQRPRGRAARLLVMLFLPCCSLALPAAAAACSAAACCTQRRLYEKKNLKNINFYFDFYFWFLFLIF
jgi:hypothetical protein